MADVLEQKGGISKKLDKEDGSGEPSDTFSSFCQVSIIGLTTLLLCTTISKRIFTNV